MKFGAIRRAPGGDDVSDAREAKISFAARLFIYGITLLVPITNSIVVTNSNY